MTLWPKKVADLIGGTLFLTLFIVFVIQVTARFGFNRPMAWTDEAAVILYVWVILWSAAFVVPEREHVAFDLIWNNAGTGARQALQIGGNLLVGALALVALPASWDYVRFMAREGTPVLGVPLFWVYLPFVFMLLALVLRCGFAVRQALRMQSPDAELRL
jgi:TRAP-type C4-dicarboxylate transport system permease small subunit